MLRETGLHTCILYGSASTGRMHTGSDIDLAVAGPAPLSAEELAKLYLESSSLLGREVDISDLRRARGTFLQEILTGGEIILNDNPEFLGNRFIDMMDYSTDLAPGIQAMLKTRIERFVDGK